MKEIKFRVWNKDEKFMKLNIQTDIGFSDYFQIPIQEIYDIMQYTGLRDKNGKEIYEGDIIKYENGSLPPKVVKFEHGMFTLGNDSLWHYTVKNKYIIIGHIYENPEMIGDDVE